MLIVIAVKLQRLSLGVLLLASCVCVFRVSPWIEYWLFLFFFNRQEEMDSQKEKEPKAAVSTTSSCRKYANDDNATFLANLKDHFNEFLNASMDEHKTCFKNTIDKVPFFL